MIQFCSKHCVSKKKFSFFTGKNRLVSVKLRKRLHLGRFVNYTNRQFFYYLRVILLDPRNRYQQLVQNSNRLTKEDIGVSVLWYVVLFYPFHWLSKITLNVYIQALLKTILRTICFLYKHFTSERFQNHF